jgi:hypothetical protein
VAVIVRAFAAIAQDLTEAGYSDADAAALRKEVEFYVEIRSVVKKHSGEELDINPYEADMRHPGLDDETPSATPRPARRGQPPDPLERTG